MFNLIFLVFILSRHIQALPHVINRQSGPTVTLSYGTFQGGSESGLDRFLGIPFAQAERFGLPQNPSTLEGVQQATEYGSMCPQQAFNLDAIVIPTPPSIQSRDGPTESEDCLFINVIRPAGTSSTAQLPVLFWIFGGGFEEGDTSYYDGSPIVTRSITLGEPVIFVSANYRLNAFGFLASAEVASAGVGNLGLRDQRFAMQWVHNNIALFGGDPTKVTLYGQSAGAMSVGIHMVLNSGNTEGLYRGAFMESGSPLPLTGISTGQNYYNELVSATNCASATDTLACLKTVPYQTLYNAIQATPSVQSYKSLNVIWRPRIDNDFISEDPMVSVANGNYARVPFVAGNVDDEGTYFSLTNLNVTTDQEAVDYLHQTYLASTSDTQFNNLMSFYPSDPTQGSPFDTGLECQVTPEFKRLAAFQGDYLLQAPRRAFIQTASTTQNTWGYLYKRGKSSSCLGSAHGDEVPEFYGSNGGDFQGADGLINFVNNLDPNTIPANTGISTLISWPKYSTSLTAPPLLTFWDTTILNITADTYRSGGMTAFKSLFAFYDL